jgi:hypothetical protein
MRQSLVVAASVIVGCLLIGLLLSGSSIGQNTAFGMPQGRYHAAPITDSQSTAQSVLICDTATGQCWICTRSGKPKWHDLGSPAATEQAK